MMGAAYQAKYALSQNESNFDEITRCLPEPALVCRPYHDAETVKQYKIIYKFVSHQTVCLRSVHFFLLYLQIYKSLVARYRKIIETAKNKTSTK